MSEDFRASYKQLKKRHKSLEADFERLLASLLENPMQGVELPGGARKVRMAITSKGRGKSGGASATSASLAVTTSWPMLPHDPLSLTFGLIKYKKKIK